MGPRRAARMGAVPFWKLFKLRRWLPGVLAAAAGKIWDGRRLKVSLGAGLQALGDFGGSIQFDLDQALNNPAIDSRELGLVVSELSLN